MKILMVHDVGALTGGAEYSLLNIRQELVKRGHSVKMVTGDSPTPEPGFSDYTFVSGDSSVFGKLINYTYNRSAKKTLRAVIREFQPDLIHACTVTGVSFAGVREMRSIPTVLDLRDYGLLYPNLHNILPREEFCGHGDEACCRQHAGFWRYYFERIRVGLHRRNFKNISAFIANSEYMMNIAERMEMTPVYNLNNPVDMSPRDSSGKVRVWDSVLFAGRLEPEKGLFQLLDSFKLVLKKIPEAILLIAGEGCLENEIAARIKDRGLTNSVELLGLINKQQLAEWYGRVRVVAVPSLWPEPFGLVGPEAMAFGVPVVASGTGGITDWLEDGRNGLIANPLDKEAFAAAIVRLLEDEILYQSLSRNALQTAERFQIDKYIDSLEKLYLEAIEEKSRSRPRNIK